MIRRLYVVGMACAMLAVVGTLSSCESEPEVEASKSPIVLYVEELEAKPEGETLRFGYDIAERKEGVTLKVECQSEWITDVVVYESLVDVTVECNRSGEERSARLELSYGGSARQLTITQLPWFEPLTLTIDKVEATSVTISVAALDEQTTWIGQVVGREWFDSFSEEDIFHEDIAYYKSMASEAELTLEEYLEGVLSHGSHSGIRMKGLDIESDYVVYVYGMNKYAQKTTALYYEAFTTTAPYEGDDVSYDIDVECERAHAAITITPSHEGVAYYHNITTREHFEACGSDIDYLVADVVATALDNYLYWDYTEAEFYAYNTEYLATSYEFEATANTEYVVFAFKWDEALKPLSEVSYVWFKTADIPPSDNELSMTISDVTQTTFYIETKTTNNDPYTIFAVPKEEIRKMGSDDMIFNYLVAEYGTVELDINQCEGDVAGTFSGLKAKTDYEVLLFGYEAGVRTTAIVSQSITTAAAGDVDACLYDVVVSDVADRTAHIAITPSDYSVWYYWNVFASSTTEEQIKEYIFDTYNSYYYADYWEFSYYELAQGETSSSLSQLRPSTDYKVVVVPMDAYQFEYTGSLRTVGEFRTADAVIADIAITAGFDAYYDGDELNAIGGDDWNFSPYAGYAVIPMSVTIEGEYVSYLYTIFDYVEGLDDASQYSDDILLDTLYEVGTNWTPAYFRGEWDRTLMIAAVAFDYEGNPSRVYRECFVCTRDGASDAQEFIDLYMGGISSCVVRSTSPTGVDVVAAPEHEPRLKRECRERDIRLIKR